MPSLLLAQRRLALEVVTGAAPGASGSLTACAGTDVLLRVIGPTLGAPDDMLVLVADSPLCADQSVLLGAGPQAANARYQWQDDSAGPTLRATLPGRYRLTVISPDGCARQASLELAYDNAGGCPLLTRAFPNIITSNGDPANGFFVLRGLNAPDWNLTVFNRWGREVFHQPAYDNRWNAAGQPVGVCYCGWSMPSPASTTRAGWKWCGSPCGRWGGVRFWRRLHRKAGVDVQPDFLANLLGIEPLLVVGRIVVKAQGHALAVEVGHKLVHVPSGH